MRAIAELARRQDGVLIRSQLLAMGVTDRFIHHRLRSMAWASLAPGVYLWPPGSPTIHQRARAATLACGPESMATGVAAMLLHGVRISTTESQVSVIVPHTSRRGANALLRPIRSRNLPRPFTIRDIPVAPIERATIDACLGLAALPDVRALLAAPVQQRRCTPHGLLTCAAEATRVTPALRSGLDEIADGVRSVPEGLARRLILASPLPPPLWNPRLYGPDGKLIAIPDAYWVDAGVALEIESREFHFDVASWNRTLKRRSTMGAAGIIVVPCPPSRLKEDPDGFIRDVVAAYRSGMSRGPLSIAVKPTSR